MTVWRFLNYFVPKRAEYTIILILVTEINLSNRVQRFILLLTYARETDTLGMYVFFLRMVFYKNGVYRTIEIVQEE